MFQYQIESLQKTVLKLVRTRRKPPTTVMIKYEHAKYLGCNFQSRKVPVQEQLPSGFFAPVREDGPRQALVVVSLLDLYESLKGAKGVEYEEFESGSVGEKETSSRPDRGAQTENQNLSSDASSSED